MLLEDILAVFNPLGINWSIKGLTNNIEERDAGLRDSYMEYRTSLSETALRVIEIAFKSYNKSLLPLKDGEDELEGMSKYYGLIFLFREKEVPRRIHTLASYPELFLRDIFNQDFRKLALEVKKLYSFITPNDLLICIWDVIKAYDLENNKYAFTSELAYFEVEEYGKTGLTNETTYSSILFAKAFGAYFNTNLDFFFESLRIIHTYDSSSIDFLNTLAKISSILLQKGSLIIEDATNDKVIYCHDHTNALYSENILNEASNAILQSSKDSVLVVNLNLSYTAREDEYLAFWLMAEVFRKLGSTRIRCNSTTEYTLGKSFIDVFVVCEREKSPKYCPQTPYSLQKSLYPDCLFLKAFVTITDPRDNDITWLQYCCVRGVNVVCSEYKTLMFVYKSINIKHQVIKLRRIVLVIDTETDLLSFLRDISYWMNLDPSFHFRCSILIKITPHKTGMSLFPVLNFMIKHRNRLMDVTIVSNGCLTDCKVFGDGAENFMIFIYKKMTESRKFQRNTYDYLRVFFSFLIDEKYVPVNMITAKGSSKTKTLLKFRKTETKITRFTCREIYGFGNVLADVPLWQSIERKAFHFVGIKISKRHIKSLCNPTTTHLYTYNTTWSNDLKLSNKQKMSIRSLIYKSIYIACHNQESSDYQSVGEIMGTLHSRETILV